MLGGGAFLAKFLAIRKFNKNAQSRDPRSIPPGELIKYCYSSSNGCISIK